MNILFAWQSLLCAGEALAVSALVVGIAWLAAGEGAASRRHLIWAAGFSALLLLPLCMFAAPSLVHVPIVTETAVAAPAVEMREGALFLPPPARPTIPLDGVTLMKLAFGVWLLGAVAIGLRAAFAAFALHRMRVRSVPHRFGHLDIDGPRCDLRISLEGHGPITWGVFRPIVLLPASCEDWNRARLETVLRHELAHVARRDCLTQAIVLAVCALYWPNPLVWMGARRLRREAEMAADDAVLRAGIRPSHYAGELLDIARGFDGTRISNMPLAMASRSALEDRVRAILAATQTRSGVTAMDKYKIAGIALTAVAVAALVRPSLAEEAPKAPANVAAPAETQEAVAPVAPLAPTEPVRNIRVVRHVSHDPHNSRRIVREYRDGNTRIVEVEELSPEEQRQVNDAVREAHEAVEAARPQMEEAVRQAHAAERVAAAIRAEQPRMDAEIARAHRISTAEMRRALASARAAIASARLDARTQAEAQRGLDEAQRHMDAEQTERDSDAESSNQGN